MSKASGTATPTSEVNNPFEDHDKLVGAKGKFLGFIEKRYVRTLSGAVHGISSILSLLLSNFVLLEGFVYPNAPWHSALQLAMALSTFLSGATLLLFWNKVQSWQLSTTSRQEKGLTIQNLRSLNQGRGVIGMMAYAIYPFFLALDQLQYRYGVEQRLMSSVAFCQTLAIGMLTLSVYQSSLTLDYSKVITLFYSGARIAFSLALLQYGSLAALQDAFPAAIKFMHDEAVFTIACVQFGFMFYYLYSRRLVSKESIQRACNQYHVGMVLIWLARMQLNTWWQSLPGTIMWYPAFLTFTTVALLVLKQLKKLRAVTTQPAKKESDNSCTDPTAEEKRRSSLQKAVNLGKSMNAANLSASRRLSSMNVSTNLD